MKPITKLDALSEPWPVAPAVEPLVHGWTVHAAHFARLLAPFVERPGAGKEEPSATVLEVGAWLGKTSLHLVETYPDLALVCVDIWRDHGIIHERAKVAFETWEANLFPYRGRVHAIRRRSEVGMVELARIGFRPDIVYIDAAHDYGSAYLDTAVACACFPDAVICGDDFTLVVREDAELGCGVGQAVTRYAQRTGIEVKVHGRFWELVR